MPLNTESIAKNQIENEQRWDVPFNLELKKIYEHDADLFTIEEMAEHITNGATPLGAQFYDEGVHFYRANDVKRFSLDYFNRKNISKSQSKALKRSILKQNDIIFTIKGKVGDVTVFPENQEESNINQDNALIRLKPEFDPYYFCGIFNSKYGLNQVKAFSTETINPFLGLGNLKKLKVPIIKTNLKDKISNKVKLIISTEIQALDILQNAQKILYSLLDINFQNSKKEVTFSINLKELNKENLWTPSYSNPLYLTTNSDIKNKWKTILLGEIVSTKKGNEVGSENYINYLDKREEDIPFIRTSDIVNFEVDQYPDFYIPKEIYIELNQDIQFGDILFSNDGKIGQVALLNKEDKVIIQSHIKRLRLNNEASKYNFTPEYLFLLLSIKEIGKYQAEKYKTIQSTIPTISNFISKFELPILQESSIKKLTLLVKQAFELKNEKKRILKDLKEEIDDFFVV